MAVGPRTWRSAALPYGRLSAPGQRPWRHAGSTTVTVSPSTSPRLDDTAVQPHRLAGLLRRSPRRAMPELVVVVPVVGRLAAAFGVKRRSVQHDVDVLRSPHGRVGGRHRRRRARASLTNSSEAHELGRVGVDEFAVDAHIGVSVLRARWRRPCPLALLRHEVGKTVGIDGQSASPAISSVRSIGNPYVSCRVMRRRRLMQELQRPSSRRRPRRIGPNRPTASWRTQPPRRRRR